MALDPELVHNDEGHQVHRKSEVPIIATAGPSPVLVTVKHPVMCRLDDAREAGLAGPSHCRFYLSRQFDMG